MLKEKKGHEQTTARRILQVTDSVLILHSLKKTTERTLKARGKMQSRIWKSCSSWYFPHHPSSMNTASMA